mgnify:CR=1 FL=1
MHTDIYTYRPNPYQKGAFQIFKTSPALQEDSPIGDYILLDHSEPYDLTERKVINLVSALNGKPDLIDLSEETGSRLYYHMLPDARDGYRRLLFRTYTGEGVSTENAILTYTE